MERKQTMQQDWLQNLQKPPWKVKPRDLCSKIIKNFKLATVEHWNKLRALLSTGPSGTARLAPRELALLPSLVSGMSQNSKKWVPFFLLPFSLKIWCNEMRQIVTSGWTKGSWVVEFLVMLSILANYPVCELFRYLGCLSSCPLSYVTAHWSFKNNVPLPIFLLYPDKSLLEEEVKVTGSHTCYVYSQCVHLFNMHLLIACNGQVRVRVGRNANLGR